MNINHASQNPVYRRSPLAKNSDLTWNMHAVQEIDYQVSVVKDILNPKNPSL